MNCVKSEVVQFISSLNHFSHSLSQCTECCRLHYTLVLSTKKFLVCTDPEFFVILLPYRTHHKYKLYILNYILRCIRIGKKDIVKTRPMLIHTPVTLYVP